MTTLRCMDNDTAFKRIFSHGVMVRDLLDWFVGGLQGAPELVARLDLAGLRRSHEQSVAGTPGQLHRFASDMVWKAPFADSPDPDPKAWLHLLLLWEFQRSPDRLMALRIRNCVDCHHLDTWRASDRRFGANDRLQPVLPVVIYTGREPWSAAQRVIDLVTPVPGPPAESLGALSRRSGLFAGDGYLLLDMTRVERDNFRDDNAMSLLAELTNPVPGSRTARLAWNLFELLAGEERDLRLALLEWIEQESGLNLGVHEMAAVESLRSADREGYFEDRVERWSDRLRAEGLTQGRAEGLTEGRALGLAAGRAEERQLLIGLAERKFGPAPARLLAALLADVDDADRLGAVGGWIIDCSTGNELVARVAEDAK